MKLLTYNLHFGGAKTQNPWKRLMEDFSPEFVFAQETYHPKEYFSQAELANFRGCIHKNVPTHEQWGSAILAKRHELEEVQITDANYSGWAVGALAHNVAIGGEPQTVLLISFHAPSLKIGSYESHVREMLNQIALKWGGSPMVIAGDFNLTVAHSRPDSMLGQNTEGEKRILSMLQSDLSLANAWQHHHPDKELPQTLRWSKDKSIPYHCDGIFLSTKFLQHVVDASVQSEGEWGEMSDHNPVLVTLG